MSGIRQWVDLISGQASTGGWVVWPRKLKVGSIITLEGDDREWTVIAVNPDRTTPRGWKVGGL